MKIISLIGNRPQFIKEAVLCEEFKKNNINEIIVNSGQHYDYNMADVFFKSLNIKKPKYNLNVGSGKHGEMTGKIMIEFEKVLEKEKPDLVLVYGDTNTTLAGAIVAVKMKIKIAHVEAGIRMIPKTMPEEINRVLTDRISDFLFCPSKKAVENLKKEGITKNVFFTGDILYDLFLKMKNEFNLTTLKKLKLTPGKFILTTLHRDYNVDNKEKLEKILKQLNLINKDTPIVFSLHPRTKKRIDDFNLNKFIKDLTITEPLDYLDLMGLLINSKSVITDSGGLQKESYFAGKTGYILMPDAGWTELIDNKYNFLCDENNLFQKVSQKHKIPNIKNIYGNGSTGKSIINFILKKY
ncbi:MAG: UDP-N-acetylglucosamine 2-epimerase (non-hydrolyzing) [Candidatus Gracilibacteria bacterium]|nr:UDP-N-acetylglucosamine 2-epimerase (non-hydrolyzing) [Candidatus Gracilibacteria bacterium]